MSRRHPVQYVDPKEKAEFERSQRRSEEARDYARQSIETARKEMTWLERALTPPRLPNGDMMDDSRGESQ